MTYTELTLSLPLAYIQASDVERGMASQTMATEIAKIAANTDNAAFAMASSAWVELMEDRVNWLEHNHGALPAFLRSMRDSIQAQIYHLTTTMGKAAEVTGTMAPTFQLDLDFIAAASKFLKPNPEVDPLIAKLKAKGESKISAFNDLTAEGRKVLAESETAAAAVANAVDSNLDLDGGENLAGLRTLLGSLRSIIETAPHVDVASAVSTMKNIQLSFEDMASGMLQDVISQLHLISRIDFQRQELVNVIEVAEKLLNDAMSWKLGHSENFFQTMTSLLEYRSGSLYTSATPTKDQIAKFKAENDRLSSTIGSLHEEIAAALSAKAELENALVSSNQELSSSRTQLESLNATIASLRADYEAKVSLLGKDYGHARECSSGTTQDGGAYCCAHCSYERGDSRARLAGRKGRAVRSNHRRPGNSEPNPINNNFRAQDSAGQGARRVPSCHAGSSAGNGKCRTV